ncbi:ParA family protein [Ferrimonas kyonanensis]|uniref:ParA family protein n=1 Tax=Ferrimonas kyonanensis TaxID=364763 RepID=UPI0004099977|nr:ParA family protein [Ferrimonas kyonanensis]
MAAKVKVVGNRKGGVLKTTSTLNLGWELARAGMRVLLIDMDSQGNLTRYLTDEDKPLWLGDVIKERGAQLTDAIYPAIIGGEAQPNLHFVPGRPGDAMSKLDIDMISLPRREERLKLLLAPLLDQYDFVLIDTSPGTSVLGLNAVMAADSFLIPTEYTEDSLQGVDTYLKHICDVKFVTEDDIDYRVLPAKVDKRETNALAYGNEYLAALHPERQTETVIWSRSVFKDAATEGEPLSVVKPGHVAAMYYRNLAREVIEHG